MTKVSPSVLAANFANLESDIKKVEDAAMLHLDVMDGHFVPNISIGVPVVESVRKCTNMFLDVHLMISNPQQYIESFCNAGADLICFHFESEGDPKKTIEMIRSFGKKAAIAVKPGTPIESVYPYVDNLDMVLVMTVEPGFGGQKFMPEMMDKVRALNEYMKKRNLSFDIQIDGGVNQETAVVAVESGVTVLVAGSCVFGSENPAKMVDYFSAL